MHATWDAGEMDCSRLLVELRARLAVLRPGDTLEVVARGPGAPVDVPAWCRMTGHTLVRAAHPIYVIRVRGLLGAQESDRVGQTTRLP